MTRALELSRVRGLALVEDGGRVGRLGLAVPRGGALDPEALGVANLAVGNDAVAAAIERYGAIDVIARSDVTIADERGRIVMLVAGERMAFGWDGARRVGYLAIGGGIDVPSFLGGAGTVLSLGRGGFEGRLLRAGDVLSLAEPRERARIVVVPDDASPIRVTSGPDLERLESVALERLVDTAWTIDPRSDRSGTRLVGPVLTHREGARAITTPMIEGAIECPPGSPPIVLGPEHPTTGGYPVVAVIARADLSRFHRMRLGSAVRFARVSHEQARALPRVY